MWKWFRNIYSILDYKNPLIEKKNPTVSSHKSFIYRGDMTK
jgi:hypothetical protein